VKEELGGRKRNHETAVYEKPTTGTFDERDVSGFVRLFLILIKK